MSLAEETRHELAGAPGIETRTPPASEALRRFVVLDLTRVRAGPTCVRQLADWGANVVKVELARWDGPGAARRAARRV